MPDVRAFADTTTLIDASATLDPADRALLNLWVNRGLDDDALAELSHLSVGVITARRHSIVERLSADLELSPQYVSDSLQELAANNGQPTGSRERANAGRSGLRPAPSNGMRARGDSASPPSASGSTDPAVDPPAAPDTSERRGRRRGSLIAVGVVFVAVLVRGRRRAHRR